jgi:hypothetical protein
LQDRYAGDVGDYVKLALIRALSPGLKLGVAWYLYPDEGHNDDGKHIAYLQNAPHWRHLDPTLFDHLSNIVNSGRSVAEIERRCGLKAVFSNEVLNQQKLHSRLRSDARADWFVRVRQQLLDCELVFADPDNGLTDDEPARRRKPRFGKSLPIAEAVALAAGRSALIYHHNSRFKGGHDREVDHWLSKLGENSLAIRANAYSCRTFFLVNPTRLLVDRARGFCETWGNHRVRLYERARRSVSP